MSWMVVAQVVAAAAQATYGFLKSASDAEKRDQKHAEMLAVLDEVRFSILSTMVEIEVAELTGEVRGFVDIMRSYDGDPDDSAEEERLRSLIDDSARVIGRLSAHIDNLPNTPGDQDAETTTRTLALESAAILAPLIYVRAQAMAERQFTYKNPEIRDIPHSLDDGARSLRHVATYVRTESDGRFTTVATHRDPESHRQVFGYRFSGRLIPCGPVAMNGTFAQCQEQRRRHIQGASVTYLDGAGPVLTAAASQMAHISAELKRPLFPWSDAHGVPGTTDLDGTAGLEKDEWGHFPHMRKDKRASTE